MWLSGRKGLQVEEAARNMRPMIGPTTFVVPLQNGVEAASQLAAILGQEHVLGGLCGTFSWVAAPGRIRSISTVEIDCFDTGQPCRKFLGTGLRYSTATSPVIRTHPPPLAIAVTRHPLQAFLEKLDAMEAEGDTGRTRLSPCPDLQL